MARVSSGMKRKEDQISLSCRIFWSSDVFVRILGIVWTWDHVKKCRTRVNGHVEILHWNESPTRSTDVINDNF